MTMKCMCGRVVHTIADPEADPAAPGYAYTSNSLFEMIKDGIREGQDFKEVKCPDCGELWHFRGVIPTGIESTRVM